jgi:MFS family permease
VRRTDLGRFLVTVVLAYAACRLVTGVLLAIVATRQVPTGWTGPDVSYLTFTAQWDGQWYRAIAEHGYPRTLPVDDEGLVQQNAWAFYPLFPFLTRALMDLTHLGFFVVGSTLSLLLGFVAAAAMAMLLRDRIGERYTLLAVALWASQPAAAALQVGYTEAMAMALLTLFLLALSHERWWWATLLAVLLGLTRPIAVPIAAVTLVALWSRWRRRVEEPISLPEGASGVAAFAGCVVSGLLWPTLAALVTGQADAYTVTMSSWRGSREIVPLRPWLDMSRYYFGETWGPVWLTVLFVGIAVLVLGPWAARLGTQLRMWSLAYPAYLLVVLDPFTSVFRYVIPLFSLAPVLLGAAGYPLWRSWRRWVPVRFGVLLVAFVIGQWYWLDILWRFIPPTDYPP